MIKDLSITIISPKVEIIWGLHAYYGQIRIGDFSETIYVPVEFWTLEDYKKQWEEGLSRIENEKKSCLVATVQGYKQAPALVNWWCLYKVDNQIVIENFRLVGKWLKKALKGEPFTPENCYQFIPRMSRRKDVSKWYVPI